MRVVCLFKRDLSGYDSFIKNSFKLLSYEDTSNRLADDSFGYQSNHYIITLPDAWQTIPSMVGVGNLKIEIQVRTLAQHMWAAVSHKLQYKNESTVPYELRRSINRSSAILELIDIEFDRVMTDRARYVGEINDGISDDERLNVDLIKRLMNDLLPSKNINGEERYDIIALELNALGISTAGVLKSIILKNLPGALAMDKEYAGNEELFDLTSEILLKRGCYFNQVGFMRNVLELEFGADKMIEVQTYSDPD